MSSQKFFTVILAAGHGTRMRSPLPKVLHTMGGRTLVEWSLHVAQKIKSDKTVVVVPKNHEPVTQALEVVFQNKKITYAIQKEQLGTGHALKCALPLLPKSSGVLTVLNGDMPLINPASLRKLLMLQKQTKAAVGFLSTVVANPTGFGRVLRDEKGAVTEVVEEKDASAAVKKISEVNLGLYVFDMDFLHKAINKLRAENQQKEYYITDLVALATNSHLPVIAHRLGDATEAMGVNTQQELYKANEIYYAKKRDEAMTAGVTLVGDQVFIDAGVKLGQGVLLESPCYLKGQTKVEKNVVIEQGCTLIDSTIKAGGHIKAHCYLDQAVVEDHCHIGPFAHLRPQTVLKSGAKIGNFVETKKTTVGVGSKINHLSYVGDAEVGKGVNVGAGTITCNYDGTHKHKTVLEDGVFIGSDTQLVAPVKVGKGAFVGAGTTVTQDVAAMGLALSRVKQVVVKGWAKRNKSK